MITSDQRPLHSRGKTMVTMQVRSIAILQRRLHPYQNGVAVAMLHAVEKTFLVAQPVQLVALTSPEACYQR